MKTLQKTHPDFDLNMTVEEFAQWLLSLDSDMKKKQIWFIDITAPYKGKPFYVETSPSKTHVSIEDAHEEELPDT